MTVLDGVAVLYGGPYDGFILADCPSHGREVATQWEPAVNLFGRNGVPSSWTLVGHDLVVSGPLHSATDSLTRTATYCHYRDGAWIEMHALAAYPA